MRGDAAPYVATKTRQSARLVTGRPTSASRPPPLRSSRTSPGAAPAASSSAAVHAQQDHWVAAWADPSSPARAQFMQEREPACAASSSPQSLVNGHPGTQPPAPSRTNVAPAASRSSDCHALRRQRCSRRAAPPVLTPWPGQQGAGWARPFFHLGGFPCTQCSTRAGRRCPCAGRPNTHQLNLCALLLNRARVQLRRAAAAAATNVDAGAAVAQQLAPAG